MYKRQVDASTEKIGCFSIGIARTFPNMGIYLVKTKIMMFDFAMLPRSLKIRLLEFVGPEIMNLDFVGGSKSGVPDCERENFLGANVQDLGANILKV